MAHARKPVAAVAVALVLSLAASGSPPALGVPPPCRGNTDDDPNFANVAFNSVSPSGRVLEGNGFIIFARSERMCGGNSDPAAACRSTVPGPPRRLWNAVVVTAAHVIVEDVCDGATDVRMTLYPGSPQSLALARGRYYETPLVTPSNSAWCDAHRRLAEANYDEIPRTDSPRTDVYVFRALFAIPASEVIVPYALSGLEAGEQYSLNGFMPEYVYQGDQPSDRLVRNKDPFAGPGAADKLYFNRGIPGAAQDGEGPVRELLLTSDVLNGQSGSPIVSAKDKSAVGVLLEKMERPTCIPNDSDAPPPPTAVVEPLFCPSGETSARKNVATRTAFMTTLIDQPSLFNIGASDGDLGVEDRAPEAAAGRFPRLPALAGARRTERAAAPVQAVSAPLTSNERIEAAAALYLELISETDQERVRPRQAAMSRAVSRMTPIEQIAMWLLVKRRLEPGMRQDTYGCVPAGALDAMLSQK